MVPKQLLLDRELCRVHRSADRSGTRRRARSGVTQHGTSPERSSTVTSTLERWKLRLRMLPRRPERIVMVDAKVMPPAQDRHVRDLDAFVLSGSRVIYLRRQSPTLLEAEYRGALHPHAGHHHLA